ncbi:phage holin family protein [Peribacillus sp. JNUCC 23]|uniref:phage holin family protein n=1 Tax=Peribacillus sp. NPDC096379 TaxID=3364393 RepID=UPI00380FB0EA
MDFLTIYIRNDALILIPVLYFIGLFLRQTPFIPAWSYAWIQVSFAIMSCLLYYGFAITSVVQGILVTGAAVVFRDLIHNTLYGINEKKSGKQWDPYKGGFVPKNEVNKKDKTSE